jgi:uracil-DNA glycosylase
VGDPAETLTDRQLLQLAADIRACRRCHERELLPPGVFPVAEDRPARKVMIIGQAPGRLTNERRMHFGGPGGLTLERWLQRAGFPEGFLRSGCYLTSLTHCFPGPSPSGSGDRAPSPLELQLCRPWLDLELQLVDPAVVLLVGKMAIDTVLGRKPLAETVGTVHERDGRTWLALPHPSGVSRWLNQPQNQALLQTGLDRLSDLREQLRLDRP